MYKSFRMKNFRCFDDLILTDLKRVNLIAGKNNVGKTALLEALWLHCGAYNPELALRLNVLRGLETMKVEFGRRAVTPWDSLFGSFDTSKPVELVGENGDMGNRELRLRLVEQPDELTKILPLIRQAVNSPKVTPGDETVQVFTLSPESVRVLGLDYRNQNGQHSTNYLLVDQAGQIIVAPVAPPPPFPAVMFVARGRVRPQEDAERFGELVRTKSQNLLLEVLRIVEPRLQGLASIPISGVSVIHGDIGIDNLVPLPFMGDGMTRLAGLVLGIIASPKGVVLIDEVENGIHHSVMRDVWQAIDKTAEQFGTQIFATTHSYECIVAAHEAFSEDEHYNFHLHRLDRVNGKIRAVTYPQGTLEAAIETGLEVR